jgi:hypothetical protein
MMAAAFETTQTMVISSLFVALILVLLIRRHWAAWHLQRYQTEASLWIAMTKQGIVVADEMSQLWPPYYLHWDLLYWRFPRYIIYQHHYQDMREWMDGQLARTDLTAEVFAREYAEAMTPPTTDPEPLLANADGDVSRN